MAEPHPSLVVKHFPSTAALVVSPDTDADIEVPTSPGEVLTTFLCKGVPIRRKEGKGSYLRGSIHNFYSGWLILLS